MVKKTIKKQLCKCGCGSLTTGLWNRTRKRYPIYVKGHTFCGRKGSWRKGKIGTFLGSNNPNWKGGKPKCNICGKILTRKEAKNCLLHRTIVNVKKGSEHHNWKGGTTSKRQKMYDSIEAVEWRKSVFERDNYTCQLCGERSVKGKHLNLNAHHILPYSVFEEFCLDIENGTTLCINCHQLTKNREWSFIPKFLNI